MSFVDSRLHGNNRGVYWQNNLQIRDVCHPKVIHKNKTPGHPEALSKDCFF
jgi:hypothetical protein